MKSMRMLLIALVVGCAQKPAKIEFSGEPVQVVHNTDALGVQQATVKDADGNALEPQPAVTWKVEPETVAKLEGSKVVPAANGVATITATTGDVHGSYRVSVALPDKVEIAGAPEGGNLGAGATVELTATVKAGDTAIEGQTIAWSTSDPAIATVDNGKVTGAAMGAATITATSGALSGTAAINVVAADAVATTGGTPAPK
jgi:hypothetical protein